MSSTREFKLWCSRCASVGNEFCRRNHRQDTQHFSRYLKKTLQSVETRIGQLATTWDHILTKRKQINDIYELTSKFLETLQCNMHQRITNNKVEMCKIASHKNSMNSLENVSLDSKSDDHLTKDAHQLNRVMSWLNHWEEEANADTAEKELQTLLNLDNQFVELKIGTIPSRNSPCESDVLKTVSLALSLKPVNKAPLLSACVSALSLLVLILNEQNEMISRENLSSPTESEHEEKDQIENEDGTTTNESEDESTSVSQQSSRGSERSEEVSCSDSDRDIDSDSDSTSVEFDEKARAMRKLNWQSTSSMRSHTINNISPDSNTSEKRSSIDTSHSKSPDCDFRCRICDKVFTDKRLYSQHLAGHNDPIPIFQCTACGKVCDSKRLFEEHVARHEQSRFVRCQFCSKVCKGKKALDSHVASHSEPKRFKCPVCPKDFKTKCLLKQHLNTHNPSKSFPCEICGKAFSHASSLSTHRRMHMSARPDPCTHCGKAFFSSEHRKRHIQKCRSVLNATFR